MSRKQPNTIHFKLALPDELDVLFLTLYEKIENLDAKVDTLLAQQSLSTTPLAAPSGKPVEKDLRAMLGQLVCRWAVQEQEKKKTLRPDYPEAWRILYSEFLRRYKTDLGKRAAHARKTVKGTSKIDIADQIGKLQDLYDLACELFSLNN